MLVGASDCELDVHRAHSRIQSDNPIRDRQALYENGIKIRSFGALQERFEELQMLAYYQELLFQRLLIARIAVALIASDETIDLIGGQAAVRQPPGQSEGVFCSLDLAVQMRIEPASDFPQHFFTLWLIEDLVIKARIDDQFLVLRGNLVVE